jgi:hypothetical protein
MGRRYPLGTPRFFVWTICCATVLSLSPPHPLTPSSQAADKLQYNRDVRPILADNCFKCHGPDSAARKADLRLDQRDAAMGMGAIVPGKPGESELARRIFSTSAEEQMPPPASHKKLTAAQKDVLKRWIAEGAEYQPHWSLIRPLRPELPKVKNAAWPRNAIDYFTLAQLEAAGLQPALEADRRTLARRLSLDLTGLPPAPEVVETFINDKSPNAYEALVDRLLASKQWGEHRGRYWLDYARYADTHGIHFDNYREIWAYRDWVIKAFNDNMPFDQFTIENLAGDLLPKATLDQVIGSGFNRCNITTNEGGIIDEEYRVLYTRDRTETTSQVWLGLTTGCAVCHDHKFDPVSQREFYEMAAFFNNTTQGARDGNIKDTPPILMVPGPQDRERFAQMETELKAARQRIDSRKTAARGEFDKWLAGASADAVSTSLPSSGLHLHASLNEGRGETVAVQLAGQARQVALTKTAAWQPGHVSAQALHCAQGGAAEIADAGDFDKDQAFSCGAWIRLPSNDSHGAIAARMDNADNYRGWDFWVEQRRVGMHIIHRWSDDALKVVSRAQVPANTWTHVLVTYDGSRKAAGVKVYINGQAQQTNVQADALKSTIRTKVPLKIGQRHASEPLTGLSLQDLRIYNRALPPQEVETLARATRLAALLAKPAPQRSASEKDELFGWWLGAIDNEYAASSQKVAALEREQADLRARGTIAHVMQERPEPAMAHILFRGEYDKRRDAVSPDTPDILPKFPADLPRNRLGFARWLLLPEQPLTARVTVNRFWQEVFGTGLVRTAGDFGVSGELSSHPELLDWLATEFMQPATSAPASGGRQPPVGAAWDIKRFFKLIVMSATYRQAAVTTPEKREKDPQNRLLSRGPRFRMDAEMIRDYALAASGLLVPKIGGPSVKPYQPDGVWEAVAMIGSNTRDYRRDTGENLYRRSMYTFWKRAAPPASLDILNAPNRETCAVRRERTNTPLQALLTLNDEQYVEAARHLAQRAIKEGGDGFEPRLKILSMRLLAREFRPEEVSVIRGSLDDLVAHYKAHPDDAKKLLAVGESKADGSIDPVQFAGWTMLANQLMNLDEVLNK